VLAELFIHLFGSRRARSPEGAALEVDARQPRRPCIARLPHCPEAPGDCFPHVIMDPERISFHGRKDSRGAERASVGKFPHITARESFTDAPAREGGAGGSQQPLRGLL
jgi:hypothetical protein